MPSGVVELDFTGFNPYFIGLPILIEEPSRLLLKMKRRFQSLFYWITYSYEQEFSAKELIEIGMFQSLFYWITYSYNVKFKKSDGSKFVSILILLDYLFL